MSLIRNLLNIIVLPLLLTAVLWLGVDAAITSWTGVRGFSLFFVSDREAGHINKPNFSGRFGGFLDSFSSVVNIGPLGERKSTPPACTDVPFILFLGDSTTAGFEVSDDETFVSQLNRDCANLRIAGANFGVRATDTHEVIGSYRRVAKKVKHDAVVYLITSNDLSENLRPFHYLNIAKRFGRVFERQFIKPETSALENFYLGVRIWVGDHFYITTKGIEVVERLRASFVGNDRPVVVDGHVPDEQVQTLIRLTKDLAAESRDSGAKLYVMFYPCVDLSGCEYVPIEEKLSAAAGDDFTVLPLAAALSRKFASNELKKDQMRFPNDSHLSAFGHKVVADEFARLLKLSPL